MRLALFCAALVVAGCATAPKPTAGLVAGDGAPGNALASLATNKFTNWGISPRFDYPAPNETEFATASP